jgi:hypothetical protein
VLHEELIRGPVTVLGEFHSEPIETGKLVLG